MLQYENLVIDRIMASIDLETTRLSNAFFYSSLTLCVIDAIFSIGVRYTSTHNTVTRYCKRNHLEMYRPYGSSASMINNEFTISDFLDSVRGMTFEDMAEKVFGNRQRTSSRNGILKAQAVYEFATVLNANEIETFVDVARMYANPKIENQLKSIRGQRSGNSLSYFYMLSGNEDLIKPDRHILNFIKLATRKMVSTQQAEQIITKCVCMLKKDYPYITNRTLDHAIWSYMASH